MSCNPRTYIAEFVENRCIELTHFCDESNRSKEDTMIAVCQKVLGFGCEMICEVWYFLNDP